MLTRFAGKISRRMNTKQSKASGVKGKIRSSVSFDNLLHHQLQPANLQLQPASKPNLRVIIRGSFKAANYNFAPLFTSSSKIILFLQYHDFRKLRIFVNNEEV